MVSPYEVPRLGSLFDHVAAPLALEDIRYLFEHRFSELAAFEILMPERNAEAQDRGRGIVDILVELLGPQAHLCVAVGIQRRQRRIWIGLVEIFENDVRFRDDLLAIDEGRHHGAAVEFEVPGLLVLRRAQHEVAAFPIELFLGEAQPHLLRAERHVVVIERQHRFLPGWLRSFYVSDIGVHSTCSMRVAPVASMTSRSKPSATPLAGGITASAARKSSSIG